MRHLRSGFRSFTSVSNAEMKKTLQRYFEGNRRWRTEDISTEKLSELSKGQSPDLLWIGCSDSRVPANDLTKLDPGSVFVTRNIANTVVHTDMSMLAVLHYSIAVLKVKHVAVVGHSSCGGIAAALAGEPIGLIDNWLRHIQVLFSFLPFFCVFL